MPLVQSVYGTIDPVKLLEEIAIWKNGEKNRASSIRSSAPELEESYSEWLRRWERVFEQTRDIVLKQKEEATAATGNSVGGPPHYAKLLEDSLNQSREFGRQLLDLRRQSVVLSKLEASHPATALADLQWETGNEALARLRKSGAIRPGVPSESRDGDDGDPEDYAGPEPADGPASAPTRRERPPSPAAAETPRTEMTWSEPLTSAAENAASPVPIGGHRLPPLPYSYKALEPHIDERTMRIHHDKHHQAYVDGLNQAEKQLEEARRTGDFGLVKHWERELAFNGAGHYLHTLFWEAMSPKGGGKPSGALLAEIDSGFGSYEAFKKQFSEAANKVEGGGWAVLVWSPRSHRLEILTAEKHQNLSQWDAVPLLPLDVWEHAYYLKHQNDRAAYVRDWWNVVNWPYVADRFAKARTLTWVPY